MEQIIIILIFLAISFINWLSKQAEEKRAREALEEEARRGGSSDFEDSDQRNPGDRLAPVQPQKRNAEEEQIRKFFEALGLPLEEVQPAPPSRPDTQPELLRPPAQAAPLPSAAQPPFQKKIEKPPQQQPAIPQPKGKSQSAAREVSLSKEEREMLERIKAGKPSEFPSARPSQKRKTFSSGRSLVEEAVALLSGPASARKAFILREILDRPVALRDLPAPGAPSAQ